MRFLLIPPRPRPLPLPRFGFTSNIIPSDELLEQTSVPRPRPRPRPRPLPPPRDPRPARPLPPRFGVPDMRRSCTMRS